MPMNRKILVVDDLSVNRRILTKILHADGLKTIEAQNGKEALDILLREKDNISLVLLDITMPIMNGYELLDKMNEDEVLTSIPVIITTSSEQDDAEVHSLERGASDFITKPYNPNIVCHRVRSILRLCDNIALLNRLESDRLTGVYSREFFYQHAQAVLDANPDEEYDIVCSNIEHFKMINAKYGIAVGDSLLRCIADHNIECIGKEGVCGRLGADMFVVLRKRRPLRSQEEIGRLYMDTFKDAPVKNFVMKYGVYIVNDRSLSVAAMCDFAQIALASIKNKYGVYYAVFDESMQKTMVREHQLSDTMEEALEKKQFVAYLQPKHDIETGSVVGAEALVRWIHPEIGFISPGEFIPLFERNGFILQLDQYILEETCAVLRKWLDSGSKVIPISVNASRSDFDYDNLPERICELVDSYGIPHELIHFEVTESAYTDNPQQMIAAVSTLRSLGFLIEMDDFGSGYSSLNMLSELPIDLLKLDMRFLQQSNGLMPNNNRSILSFIVSLSKWLQLPTIAEGVETKEEIDLLRTMGCNYIQGYYYAKPMPVSEFEDYLADYKVIPTSKAKLKVNESLPFVSIEDETRPNILVVEDIESNRELLKELLKSRYNVSETSNGRQAYEYIKDNHEKLSCILLDLLMPEMDGFQLLDLMRKEGYLDKIPVIITTEAGVDSELRALHLGADSFVAKPYNSDILLHHVKKAVNEHQFRIILNQSK